MELLCDDCQAVIHIPAGRVPINTNFRVTCPRCNRRIIASSEVSGNKGETASPLPRACPRVESRLEEERSGESWSETVDPLQSGQFVSLVCIDQQEAYASLKSLLGDMGYKVDHSTAPDHVLQRLRFNQYHLVILDDEFGRQQPDTISAYLVKLNMNTRRDMFVVLLGERFKTGDPWQAFVESVNLVCHPNDLLSLRVILPRALKEHERFYRVFNEALIAAGKKI